MVGLGIFEGFFVVRSVDHLEMGFTFPNLIKHSPPLQLQQASHSRNHSQTLHSLSRRFTFFFSCGFEWATCRKSLFYAYVNFYWQNHANEWLTTTMAQKNQHEPTSVHGLMCWHRRRHSPWFIRLLHTLFVVHIVTAHWCAAVSVCALCL